MQQTEEEKKIVPTTGRDFWWMPRLDGYILKEFLMPYCTLLFAFCLLFLMSDVFNDLGKLLENKKTFVEAARYFSLRLPEHIPFILPITILLSSIYTLANFGRNREITAMRASGISLFRCGRMLFVMGLLTTGLDFWLNESLVPRCKEAADEIRDNMSTRRNREQRSSKFQYHSGDGKRSWFFQHFDADGIQKNVKLKFFRIESENSKRPERIIEAETAEFYPEAYKNENGKRKRIPAHWVFNKAVSVEFTEDGLPGSRRLLLPPDNVFSIEEIPEQPASIEKLMIAPENLSTAEICKVLRQNEKMAPKIKSIYRTLFFYRLAFPWVCFFCVFLALPLAAKNERAGIFLSITTAVLLVVVFHLVSEFFLLEGKNGDLPPILAGLAPTVALAIYSIRLAKKAD